jgi:hypothetical protein
MTEKTQEFQYSATQDNFGNRSSKRIAGLSMIFWAMIVSTILICTSVFRTISDMNFIIKILEIFIGCGCGLLGIGIFEKISFSKKRDEE